MIAFSILAVLMTGAALAFVLVEKDQLLSRARRALRLKTILDLWLYIHVPLSIALLAALVVHVLAVFIYW